MKPCSRSSRWVRCWLSPSPGGIAWKYARLTRQAEIALGVLTAEQSRVSAELRRADDRLAAASRTRRAVARSSAAVVGARYAAGNSNQTESVMAEKVKDPKVQLIELAAARARGASSYGWFFRKAGLTPAQIEKFQDNLAARDEQYLDLDSMLRINRASAPAGSRRRHKLRWPSFAARRMPSIRHPSRNCWAPRPTRSCRIYDRALPAQAAVSALAGDAVLAGVPLTEQQAEQLTEVVAGTSGDYQKGGVASAASIDSMPSMPKAPSLLSAAQLNVLKTVATPRDGRFWESVRQSAHHSLCRQRPLASRLPPFPGN